MAQTEAKPKRSEIHIKHRCFYICMDIKLLNQSLLLMIRECDGTHRSFAEIACIYGQGLFKTSSTRELFFLIDGEWKKDEHHSHIRNFLSTTLLHAFLEVSTTLSRKMFEQSHGTMLDYYRDRIKEIMNMSLLLKDHVFKNNVVAEILDILQG